MTARLPTEERRAQITDAAMKIIGERGLRAFTIAQIAREVGIRDGTVFRHFSSKDEIVQAVLDRLEEIFSGTYPPPIDDPLERLSRFFMKRVEVVMSQPGVHALVFSDELIHAGGKIGLERVMRMRKQAQRYIHSCLFEAAEKNLLRPDINLEDIVVLFHGAVMSVVFLSKSSPGEVSLGGLAGRVLKTLLSLIRR